MWRPSLPGEYSRKPRENYQCDCGDQLQPPTPACVAIAGRLRHASGLRLGCSPCLVLLSPLLCLSLLFFGSLARLGFRPLPRFLRLLLRLFARTATLLLQVGDRALDSGGDLVERCVVVRPLADRLAIFRHRLQAAERRPLPPAGAEDDRNYPRLAKLMSRKCLRHLLAPAIVGGNEVGTDQQQDDVGRCQLPVYLSFPLVAGTDHPVVPFGDQLASTQEREMRFEFAAERLVAVRVGVE